MADSHDSVTTTEVRLPSGAATLIGDLMVPAGAGGLVVFAHGSGSGRHSSRNRMVARRLQEAGLATLLLDLLTIEEETLERETGHIRFDIALLGRRMQDVTTWVGEQPALRSLALGYFGASTGSAAALVAAARLGTRVAALVSRGGRPDLAGAAALEAVTAPTLLVVGGADTVVLDLNEAAARRLRCPHELVVVPGATHLFGEPGALDEVARLAAGWFTRHLLHQEVAA
jgi:dienelactone hydrolase